MEYGLNLWSVVTDTYNSGWSLSSAMTPLLKYPLQNLFMVMFYLYLISRTAVSQVHLCFFISVSIICFYIELNIKNQVNDKQYFFKKADQIILFIKQIFGKRGMQMLSRIKIWFLIFSFLTHLNISAVSLKWII